MSLNLRIKTKRLFLKIYFNFSENARSIKQTAYDSIVYKKIIKYPKYKNISVPNLK